ncbi:MAG: peptide-binding protein [Candidatus Omnitrophica bacterium]|nr:peptide-binding protein [Candidatus Omnitrophota bacterium]
MKTKIPLIFLAVSFLFVSAIIPAENSDTPYGDAIVVSSIADARTLIPILSSDSSSSDICGMVFNGLVKYDKNINIIGDLAESWDILDDGLVIVFHLRKGVAWHDGAPFTAKDVEFTYRKLMDPAVKTPYSGDFDRIRKLEILDDYTVKVTYKEPFAPGLSSWGMWIMPEHILKNEDLNNTAFSRHPIGTGPYKFKTWKTGEKIELVSNHGYFEGRPYIDRYIYRVIPDDATVFLELQTQGVDLSTLSPLQYTRQTNNGYFKEHYTKFKYPGFGFTYMAYNLSDPKFGDPRVRQAMNYAVNKQEIVNTIFFGLASVTTGPYMMDSWAYNKDVMPAPYDLLKAKSLLAEAGWEDGNRDGWVEKDGKDFEFTLIVNQGNAERLRTAEMIQKYLKDVGIRMKIRVLEWSALINEFINKKRFEAVLMGWFLSRDPDNYDIWHSSKTREGEFNFIGYKNPEVDRLLEEGRRTFDQARRQAAYHGIHQILYEEQPYMFLYSGETLPIINKRFKNVEVSPIGIGYNFIKWYVPKSEQKYK